MLKLIKKVQKLKHEIRRIRGRFYVFNILLADVDLGCSFVDDVFVDGGDVHFDVACVVEGTDT